MKILTKIIHILIFRSKIPHYFYLNRMDDFFEILEYRSLEKKNLEDKFTAHLHVHDRYYDTAVKNKYYSQSFTLKGERKLELLDDLSFGFGSDYNYNKGDFQVKGNWGSSAKGHADNLGLYSNLGYKLDDTTSLSAHLRGDSHKYSQENLTYRLNLTKMLNNFTLSLGEVDFQDRKFVRWLEKYD